MQALDGSTPLAAAMQGEHREIERMLRSAGAHDVHVHPFVACDGVGKGCACVTGRAIMGKRWHKIDCDFDLCAAAFALLPDPDKAHFVLIEQAGSMPVPYEDCDWTIRC